MKNQVFIIFCLLISISAFSQIEIYQPKWRTYMGAIPEGKGQKNSSGQPTGEWRFANGYQYTDRESFNYDTYISKMLYQKTYYDEDKTELIEETGKLDSNFERTGQWKEFYRDGSLRAIGRYEYGNPVGTWKVYHPNSELKKIKFFENGSRVGEWKEYFTDGKIAKIENYQNDRLTGKNIQIERYNGYETKIVGSYKNSSKEGEFITYLITPTAELIASKATYKNGKVQGDYINYNEEGDITSTISYDDEGYISETKDFYDDGTLKKRTRPIDKATDEVTEYYKNGNFKRKILFKENIQSGTKNIHTIVSYKDVNGNDLDYGSFKDGNGTLKMYYAEGELEDITTYKNGMPKGPFKEFGYVTFNDVAYVYTTTGEKNANGKTGNSTTTIEKDGKTITLQSATYFQNVAIEEKNYDIDGITRSEISIDKNTGKKTETFYYPSGSIKNKLVFQYPNTLLNVLVYKGPNGEDLNYGTFKDGNGTFKSYDDSGKLEVTYTFKDGVVISKE